MSAVLARPEFFRYGLLPIALAGAGILYVFDPAQPDIFPTCPFLSLTGCYCPGCGTLRALHQLLNGNIVKALGYNVLTVAMLPFLAYSLGTAAGRRLGMRVPGVVLVDHRLIWALFAGIVLFWVARNVPMWPLTVLAP